MFEGAKKRQVVFAVIVVTMMMAALYLIVDSVFALVADDEDMTTAEYWKSSIGSALLWSIFATPALLLLQIYMDKRKKRKADKNNKN